MRWLYHSAIYRLPLPSTATATGPLKVPATVGLPAKICQVPGSGLSGARVGATVGFAAPVVSGLAVGVSPPLAASAGVATVAVPERATVGWGELPPRKGLAKTTPPI